MAKGDRHIWEHPEATGDLIALCGERLTATATDHEGDGEHIVVEFEDVIPTGENCKACVEEQQLEAAAQADKAAKAEAKRAKTQAKKELEA